jgi:hypothetical protein
MKISSNMRTLRKYVREESEMFFKENDPIESQLVLDGTGPSITRQYIVLNEIGAERLKTFQAIHAFSGGVYALIGYFAFSTNSNLASIEHLCTADAEWAIRDHHHQGRFSGIRTLFRLATGKSAFLSPEPVIKSLEYILGDFVERPFSVFPQNLRIYLALEPGGSPLCLSNDDTCDPKVIFLRDWPIKKVIAMAVNVPFVYGGVHDKYPYFDAVYCAGYLDKLKSIGAHGIPTLTSTPWRSGRKGHSHFLKCFPKGNPRWQMLADFLRLIVGMRNKSWSADVYTAFRLVGARTT